MTPPPSHQPILHSPTTPLSCLLRHCFLKHQALLFRPLLDLLEKAGFQPPTKEELSQSLKIDQKRFADILKLMSKEGSLIRINESVYLTSSTYKQMIEDLRSFFSRKPDMTVAEFRDVLQTSRKYALPFLEYLDSNKITMRVGDVRKLLLK